MRAIKFRAWDKMKHRMLENADVPIPCMSESDLWIVMQYTGLKDKNGKEIYEGDVVEFLNHNTGELLKREVKWNKTFMGWDIYSLKHYIENTPISKEKGLEIIGNIYENHFLE